MHGQDFERAIEAAETPEAVWEAFTGFFRGSEVRRLSYLHLPPLGAPDNRVMRLRAEGFPEALVSRYIVERQFRDNPVLSRAQRQIEPVYWEDALAAEHLTERQRAFVDECLAADLGHGVGIHVYGPNGRDGHCGLGFEEGVRKLRPDALNDYRWACQLGHLRFCALLLPTLGPVPRLSEREAEVLAWVARGKTNASVGDILGISAHTVDAHMRRICLKLGVFDRISAAVRGIGVGLIHADI